MRDLEDVPELGPGHRRDKLTGEVFHWSKWIGPSTATVGPLPEPDIEALREAENARNGEPADPVGAAVIANQLSTMPEDGWIGPRKTLQGLEPTVEDQVRFAAGLLVNSIRSAVRRAEKLAEAAGVASPIQTSATGAAQALARLAERIERDCRV